ncbi:MAG: hypothetical protein IKY43_06495, partial [Bacteroidales bacterium]|nr:hypothetical protein [Bacteroidales bacterium]
AWVKFHIDDITTNNIVFISYDCSTTSAFFISKLVTFLKEKIPNGIRINTNSKKISIDFSQLKGFEKVFKIAHISNITFDQSAIEIHLSLIQ